MAETGIHGIAEKRTNLYHVNIENIVIDENFNVREDYGDMDELSLNISQNGQKLPGIVRLSDCGKKVILVDGHRRFKAIQLANKQHGAEIKTFKCTMEGRGSNEESRIVDMLTTSLGKPLSPLEQAKAIKRLVDFNWTISDIAKSMGKSVPAVNKLLDLNSASRELRSAVQKKEISTTAASELARQSAAVQKKVLSKSKKKTNETEKEKGKKKKLTVSDIHKETKGKLYMVSTKKIQETLTTVENLKETLPKKDHTRIEGVIIGLKLALEQTTIDEIL